MRRRLLTVLTIFSLIATVLPAAAGAQERPARPDVFEAGEANRVPVGGPARPREPERPERGAEVVELRSERSRSFRQSDGSVVTEISEGREHFRDAGGALVPIDSRLRREGDRWLNSANDVRVELPESLGGGAVSVAHGGGSVAFALQGAGDVAAVVDDATATYAGALDGVDVRVTATPEGVKEDLVLGGPESARTFAYSLTADGLTPELLADGAVALRQGDGGQAMTIPPAYAVDAAGAVTTAAEVTATLTPAGQGWTLAYTLTDAWADAPERAWPVTVDPTVTVDAPALDCTIHTPGQENTTCHWRDFGVGYNEQFGLARGLVRFDVAGSLPTVPMQVRNAELRLTRFDADEHMGEENTGPVRIDAHEVTTGWDSGVTWTERNSADEPWTPGGEFVSDRIDSKPDAGVVGQRDVFYVTRSVQRWVDGDAANHGLLLKTADESQRKQIWYANRTDADPARRPKLAVVWTPLVGVEENSRLETFELGGGRTVDVNVVSGNAMFNETDLTVRGTNGYDLTLSRTWNELNVDNLQWGFGWKWFSTLSDHGRIHVVDAERAVAYRDPDTGYEVAFTRAADGAWDPARRIDATLTRDASGGWLLDWHGSGEQYRFYSWGQLDYRQDRNGNRLTFNYGYANGHYDGISSVTDSQGRVTTIERGTHNQITAITDPAGRVHRYAYGDFDPIYDRQLDTYTDPAGSVVTYDELHTDAADGGREDVLVDEEGNRTYLRFYPSDAAVGGARIREVRRVTDAATLAGHSWTFSYDDAARTTTVTDPRGNATTYHYNPKGLVERVVDANGNAQVSEYDSNSNVIVGTDGLSQETAFGFSDDGRNNLTSISAPTGAATSLAYTSPNNLYAPSSLTSPQGSTLTYDYDAAGNLASVVDDTPGAGTTSITRNPDGTIATATDPRGKVTRYGYDGVGNLTSMTPPAPVGATTIGYDSLSRITSVRDGAGRTTRYAYDVLDRPTLLTYDDASTVTYRYDGLDNAVEQVDATGTRTWAYDARNLLEQETAPGGRSTSYTYDPTGNLRTLVDASGTVTYDSTPVNLVSAITEPGGNVTRFSYDARNSRTETRYPNGVVQSALYDRSNRLTSVYGRDASGALLTASSYGYTSPTTGADTGLRQSLAEQAALTGYGYDRLDRLTQVVETDASRATIRINAGGPATTVDGVTWDRCDAASSCGGYLTGGFRWSEDRAIADEIPTTNDALYQSEWTGGETSGVPAGESAFQFDFPVANGEYRVRLHFAELNKSADGTRVFDVDVEAGQARLDGFDVHAQAGGPHRAIVRELAATVTDGVLTVDFIRQVENAKVSAIEVIPVTQSHAYGYDPAGNRTSETVGATTTTAAFDDANQLTERGGITFSYNGAGDLTGSSAGAAYDYNARSQTTSLRTTSSGPTVTASYAGPNQVTRDTASGTTFTDTQLGVTRQAYADGTADSYTRDNTGTLVGIRDTGSRNYPLVDGLGSVLAVTADDGTVRNRYDYGPYGETTQSCPTGDCKANPWRYTGEFQDATGLYKIGLRYYQPDLGRWTQRDPLIRSVNPTQPPEANPYAYVGCNPINYTDPTGALTGFDCLFTSLATGGILLGVGIVLATGGVGVAVGVAYSIYAYLFESAVAVSCYYASEE